MSSSRSATALLRVLTLMIVCVAASLPSHAATTAPKPGISEGFTFSEQDGEGLYHAICQGCHMPDGQGAQAAGMYPALAGNPRLAASAYPVLNVLNGLRGMPSFKAYLSDEQVAAVVDYVRTNMGNNYKDTVTAASVKALRR